MVIVYDTTLRERISSITFEEERFMYLLVIYFAINYTCFPSLIYSPTYLPCSLYWQDTNVLLVGRGHIVKVSGNGFFNVSQILPYQP